MATNTKFTELLQAACEAAEQALDCAKIERHKSASIVQVVPQELRYEAVAAAHYHGSDMRRIILACGRELADKLRDSAATQTGVAPAGDPGSSGLTWLGTLIQKKLVNTLGVEHHDQSFLHHDAERFRIRIHGARNFLLRLPTVAGDLRVIVDLQPHSSGSGLFGSESGSNAGITADQESRFGIEDKKVIAKIIRHLVHFEADVEIKLTENRGHFHLLPATVLTAGLDLEQSRFTVTVAGLDRDRYDDWCRNEVDIVFFVQQKLLQGACSMVDLAQGYLNETLHLPLLQLRFPEQISYGQRRGAFRIVPPKPLKGKIRRVIGNEESQEKSGAIAVQVQDVSYTGARVGISVNTILSGLKWGTPVDCAIDLPAPYRSVNLRGIVRSLILNDATGAGGASVGIEFLSGETADSRGLQELRRYIENHHRDNLTGGVELEPCQA